MSQQEQLERARQQLAEVQQRIQEQAVNEEVWQHAQEQKRIMDEQMRMENGQFSFQSEQDFYMVTKLRLDEEIAALEAAIEAEHPPVPVEASVRQEQEPPAEPAVEQVGVFARFSAWIKKVFTKQTPENPETPQPVQEKRLTRKQRNAKLAEADKQANRWDGDGEARMEKVMEVMQKKPGSYGTPSIPAKCVPVQYDDLMSRFLAAGWRNKKGNKTEENLPEWTQMQQKTELQEFLRELSNPDLLDRAQMGDTLQLNVSEYSRESILEILENNSSEAVEKFLQPLLNFDSAAFLKRFPLHKMTEEKRIARAQKLFEAIHPYLGMIQWAEKFGEHIMSPELMQRYLVATQQVNMISLWATMAYAPTPYSFGEIYQLDLKRLDLFRDYTAHGDELRTVGRETEQELRTGAPAQSVSETQMETLGLRMLEWKYLARMGTQAETNGRYQCYIPEETIEKLRSGDLEQARAWMEQVRNFSLITEEGRPRLAGDEPVDQLLRYGREDALYYGGISEAATLLKALMEKHPDKLAALGLDTPEKVQAMKTQIKQAQNVYDALMGERLLSPDRPFSLQRDKRNNGLNDPNWFLRRQNAELDAFEGGQ